MRVVAGRLRGRRLWAPAGDATRPTSDRVKEALFSVLASFGVAFEGAHVLDLYAGTGALGIEAISRGASRVVFVEHAALALRALRKNIDTLGLQASCEVFAVTAEKAIGILRKGPAFDLVLCDPPYADVESAVAVLARIAASTDLARPETVLVLEHAAREVWSDPALSPELTRSYGGTALTLFRPAPPSG